MILYLVQKQAGDIGVCANLLLVCLFKLIITGNDSSGEGKHSACSSVAETSKVEVKVTTMPFFSPHASYRVLFHQNAEGALKHLPPSLIRGSFPFWISRKEGGVLTWLNEKLESR